MKERLSVGVPGGGEMEFCRIPAGTFRIGSRGFFTNEEPQVRVVMPEAYYMGRFPVTQRQFDAWARAAGVDHKHRFSGSESLPAQNMDWHQAAACCEWISMNVSGLPAGWSASLPTETEWEYACRAGTTTEYWSGDGEAALRDVGWYEQNSKGRTHVVGELPANPWGLHDMHGNVWEWCLDPGDQDAYRARVDGELYDWRGSRRACRLEDSQANRVVRGGSWFSSAGGCRSAYRVRWHPGNRFGYLGFRVCLLPGPVVGPSQPGAGSDERARVGTTRGEPSRPAPQPATSEFEPVRMPPRPYRPGLLEGQHR